MDGARFDRWTRRLTHAGSRRGVLRMVVAGWLATGGAIAGGSAARGAPCKGHDTGCDKNGDCCRGLICKGGKCACKGSAKACGDACCAKGETCLGGGQQKSCCPAGKVCDKECCGPHKVCVCPIPPDVPGGPPDPTPPCVCRCVQGWEENSKGECVCKNILCGLECCEEDKGERCCGRNAEICTNFKSSKKHCGECGNVCPKHLDCVGGECRCQFGSFECDGECVKHACAEGHSCANGQCMCQQIGQSCRGDDDCCSNLRDDGSVQSKGACFDGVCYCCAYVERAESHYYHCCESAEDWVVYCNDPGGQLAMCCTSGPDCDELVALLEQDCDPHISKPGICAQ
ncbi:MAG: hypothetical protein M3464_01315 [Chloroflexota bacterium]|nr:hypothetical protein [Chloroflexota bacterium]